MKNKNTKFYIGGAVALMFALIFIGGGENRELQQNQFGGSTESNTHNQTNSNTDSSGNLATAIEGDFTLKKLGGGEITLSDYRGDKPVILDFWASWCPNCRRDMPKLSGFYEKYKDEVEVIGINLQEREAVASKYIESAGIKFPIVLDPSGVAARKYGVNYTNYHVMINRDGSIAGTVPGDILESHIVALLDAQPTKAEVIGGGDLEINIVE